MRKQEQRLWDGFKRNRPAPMFAQRVENVVAEGTPDLYCMTINGRVVWIELKAPKRPARETTRYLGAEGLNVDQENWFINAAIRKLIAFVLIRDDDLNLMLIPSSIFLHHGSINGLTEAELKEYSVADNWSDVFACINTLTWSEKVN